MNAGDIQWSLDEAPFDDEPLTEEDRRALAEAAEDVAEGRVLSHAEARRLLRSSFEDAEQGRVRWGSAKELLDEIDR